MEKSFDDFMVWMEQEGAARVLQYAASNPSERFTLNENAHEPNTYLRTQIALLREYHEWLQKQ